MIDPVFQFASFFVALLIALGAIPFGRKVIGRMTRSQAVRVTREDRSAVGGFALLLGIGISAFYISTTIPVSAIGLGYAAVVAMVVALVDKYAREKFGLKYSIRMVIKLVAMVFVTIVLIKPASLVSNATQLPSWLMLGVCSLLPLALARSGELTDRFAPARTSYLFCLMIAGIVLIGLHDDFATVDGTRAVIPVIAVFLTVFSALLACLFHMADLPWRRGTITMGLLGHFVLGLTLGWAALLMASTSVRPAVTVISLTLIVAAPIFSTLSYWIIRRLDFFSYIDRRAELPNSFKWRAAILDYVMTSGLVAMGLLVTWSGMHWAIGLVLLVLGFVACLFLIAFSSTVVHPLAREQGKATTLRDA